MKIDIFKEKYFDLLIINNKSLNYFKITQEKNKIEINKIKIIVPTLYFYPEIARYLQEKFLWQIEFVEPEDFNEILTNKNYQAVLFGLNYSHPPLLFSFFSKLGYNINNLDNLELERSFQQLITDPQIKMNEKLSEIEKNILDLKMNVFLVNPYYFYILNKKISGFDQFYLPKPEERFVKIETWFRK